MSSDHNAKLYEKLLLYQAEGRALFHPRVESPITGGTVGDCGYIKEGRFWQLFSVFSPPTGLLVGTLATPEAQFRPIEELPNPSTCYKSSASSSVVVHGQGGTPFASFPVDLNANIAFSKKESSFAFLAFSQQYFQRDVWIETRLLEDYLVDYESIIRGYYSTHDIAKGKLLLVYGTTKTKGWCGGVASGLSTSVDVQLRVGVAGQVLGNAGITVTHSTGGTGPGDEVAAQNDDVVAQSGEMEAQSGETEVQTEAQRGLTWALTSGPAHPSPGSGQDTDAALFPYCVVVCPVTVRWRAQLRALIRLPVKAAHPRAFLPDVPEPRGSTSQQSNIPGSSSLPTASQVPNSSTKGTTRMSDLHEVDEDADVAAATDDADDSDDDDDSDESSDDDGPPDLLSSILDSILDVRPDIELAVGAWTAITGYATTYGSLPMAEDCVKVIEPANNRHGKAVAHLARIEPVPAHHIQSPQDLIPHLEMTSSHSIADLTNKISKISRSPIAFGGYSDIYQAKWKNHGNKQDVALKVARSSPEDAPNVRLRLIRLAAASKRLKHRNIVEVLGTYSSPGGSFAIVMPFYNHGSIQSYLDRRGRENNEELRYSTMLQVMLGVEYLHAQGIVHGDIRASKVLVADDGTPKLNVPPKLWKHWKSGGGYDSDDDDDTIEGDFRSMAPERFLDGTNLSFSTDIWSCGSFFIEMESGERPWHSGTTLVQVSLALASHEPPPRPDNMSDAIWAIDSQCFDFDPAQRPSATEVAAQLRRLLSVRVVQSSTPEEEDEEEVEPEEEHSEEEEPSSSMPERVEPSSSMPERVEPSRRTLADQCVVV